MENSDDEYDSSEDERDKTKEGKGPEGTQNQDVCSQLCLTIKAGCARLVSKPDTVERELREYTPQSL